VRARHGRGQAEEFGEIGHGGVIDFKAWMS
jgi:hypothetical protein